jgi:hypothetical protein
VVINNLPSGVQIVMQCVPNYKQPVLARWDVTSVIDPWYVINGAVPDPRLNFAGVCVTGKIAESAGNVAVGGCRIVDKQVALYYGCNVNTPMVVCKQNWCSQYGGKLTFTGVGTQQQLCNSFVNSVTSPTNFLAAACTMTQLPSQSNPASCSTIQVCQQCVDDVTDFPDQIATILGSSPPVVTAAPTSQCPPNLLTLGLNRKKLSTIQSGIQIDFYDTSLGWQSVFALQDSEIAACGGCQNVLYINGSVSSDAILLVPGTYRTSQIIGYNPDPNQNLCQGVPAYNTTTWFSNPYSGTSVSTPFGSLYAAGDLVCSPSKYPNCPTNYACCVWDRQTQAAAWTACMAVYHGGASLYPFCGK